MPQSKPGKKDSLKIAVASGKGGTGKTLVSTNLFYSLIKENNQITLVDCDAEEPNARLFFEAEVVKRQEVTQKVPVIDTGKCVMCGKCHEFCNYGAIFFLPKHGIIEILEEQCHGCGACSFACNYKAISEKSTKLGEVTTFDVSQRGKLIEAKIDVGVYSPVQVIKAAIRMAEFGSTVIMDAPPGTSCPFIQTVASADFVVLVSEPTPFGLSDLKHSVETLKQMNIQCGVIVNKAGLGDNKIYNFLENEKIPLLMHIPFSKEIASTYSRGELFVRHDKLWQQKFINMFYQIFNLHGDSNNKR